MHVCVHVCVCGPSEVVRVRAWVHTWWAGSKQLAAPTTPSPVHPHTHCHCCPVSVKLLLAGTPRWVFVGPPARPCPPPPRMVPPLHHGLPHRYHTPLQLSSDGAHPR